MEDAFQSGAATCLICIASVKRNEGVSTNELLFIINLEFYKPTVAHFNEYRLGNPKGS